MNIPGSTGQRPYSVQCPAWVLQNPVPRRSVMTVALKWVAKSAQNLPEAAPIPKVHSMSRNTMTAHSTSVPAHVSLFSLISQTAHDEDGARAASAGHASAGASDPSAI